MANPIPCGRCDEVADADLLVTDRTPDFQLLGVPTSGLCVRCYIEHAMQLANAIQAAMAEMEKLPDAPGVLESVEADEGEVTPAERVEPLPKSKAKKEPAAASVSNGTETAAADVDS